MEGHLADTPPRYLDKFRSPLWRVVWVRSTLSLLLVPSDHLKLAALHNEGSLSTEEFRAAKAKLLGLCSTRVLSIDRGPSLGHSVHQKAFALSNRVALLYLPTPEVRPTQDFL